MNKTKIFLKMVALAVVGAVMSGCAEEIEVLQPANQRVVQKTTISLADDATTRGAIAADGSTSFLVDDQIAVIYQDTNGKTMKAVSAKLTSTDLTDEGASATFTVELVSPKAGTKVRYIYPASMAAATIAEDTAPDADLTISTAGLAKQGGTLEAIAKNLGLAVYDGTMSATATLPTGTGVELKNQLAIVKLATITDGTNDMRANITDLTITVGTNTYAVTRTAEDAPIFVAILPVTGNITITAIANGLDYSKTTESSKTLAKNKIYPVNLSMNFDTKSTPLTIEAIEAGAQVNFDINTDVATNGVQYRTFSTASGWSDWADYTDNDPITLTSIGDKVQFWGDNEKYGSYPESNIQFDKDCYAYGNIMSLINSTDFITETTLTGSYNFCKLFYNNTHLKSHADKPLMLPATTLTDYCYAQMFLGCTSLTIAPKLPAMEMKEDCYSGMFQSCTSLIAVPDLLATTLADYCYFGMFQGCTELVTALKLPATTLAEGCYLLMFNLCSKLATVPADMLPATTLAEYCYLQMFRGTKLATAPVLPATTLAKNCYCGMFSSCSSLTTAPELRATTLTEGCYSGMFENCTKLSSVTCLATNISADCLYGWLSEAGIEDGCGRVVYVDPSMLTVGTGNEPGKWNLDNSGDGGTKKWTLSNKDFLSLTSADIGKVIGANGCIYANAAAATTAGTTAEAVIAYVGRVPNYFDQILAIALTDANDIFGNWGGMPEKVGSYAAAHPITIGTTTYITNTIGDAHYDIVANDQNTSSATRTTGVVKGWRMPSVTDWRYIIEGFGGPAVANQAGVTDRSAYGDGSALRSAINTACGNEDLRDYLYWTSSRGPSDGYTWSYRINNSFSSEVGNHAVGYVRAVFAY